MILKELLFPRRCPVCDRPAPYRKLICEKCIDIPKIIKSPKCYKCGKALDDDTKEYCFDCATKKHIYERGLALYEYRSINESIYRYKYKNRAEYSDYFGMTLAMNFAKNLKEWNVDGIIAVPLHKSKMRIRGYNQAALIAKSLSEYTKIPFYENLIIRRKKTVPLKELDSGERYINLKNAFILARFDVKLSRVVIVDDIYTTGSTIDTISSVLKGIGVEKVYFITLAIGKGL